MLGTVTLTTDFGTGDPYVGAIKGVLLSTSPQIQLIDLSHDVPPQDILAGAYLLQHAAVEFPAGTVHLAVVDPGVGSARRALVVDAGGYHWVGPDNGLFSFALGLPGARAFEITHPDLQRDRLSATFHGRDLFAPTAARLAAGFCVVNVGPAIDDPVRLAPTRTVVNSTLIEGHPSTGHGLPQKRRPWARSKQATFTKATTLDQIQACGVHKKATTLDMTRACGVHRCDGPGPGPDMRLPRK